jgi:hypothetical protein
MNKCSRCGSENLIRQQRRFIDYAIGEPFLCGNCGRLNYIRETGSEGIVVESAWSGRSLQVAIIFGAIFTFAILWIWFG